MDPTSASDAPQGYGDNISSGDMQLSLVGASIPDTGLLAMANFADGVFADDELQAYEDQVWSNRVQPARLEEIGFKSVVKSSAVQEVGLPMAPSSRATDLGRWASKGDWTDARLLIERLYVDESKTLKEVMAIVEVKYGFRATPKMYKDRIKIWGLDKNNKEHEIVALLRKKTQRDSSGKRSVMSIRGRAVAPREILRYLQRKGVALNKVSGKYVGASTPPGVSCTTPPASPRFRLSVPCSPLTPRSLAIPEQLLFYIDRYMSVSFVNDIWVADKDGKYINTICVGDRNNCWNFYHYLNGAIDLLWNRSFIGGRRSLSKAFGFVPRLIKEENPRSIEFLLRTIGLLIRTGFLDIAIKLSGYISTMASFLLNAEHPWSQICRLLGNLEPCHMEEVIIENWKCMNNVYVQFLGRFHELSINSEMTFISHSLGSPTTEASTFDIEKRLRKLRVQCREEIRTFSSAQLSILKTLWLILIREARYVEAEKIACEFARYAREAKYPGYEVNGLKLLAISQFRQGESDLAERNLLKAIEVGRRHCESSGPWALSQMLILQSLLQLYRLEQKAAGLGPEIEHMMTLAKLDDEDL